jgi:hypothetical protein
MAIKIDQIVNHPGANNTTTGNDYQPPGITGEDWCHCVSTVSYEELRDFFDNNLETIGVLSSRIRRPIDGSFVTYIGLNADERDLVIGVAGPTTPGRQPTVFHSAFDYDTNSPPATYEP